MLDPARHPANNKHIRRQAAGTLMGVCHWASWWVGTHRLTSYPFLLVAYIHKGEVYMARSVPIPECVSLVS